MVRPASLRADVLTACAGFVDAAGFITLVGIFTAHLSGDTTHLAVDLGRGHAGADAVARIVVITTFVLAVVGGTLAVATAGRAHRALLLIEAGLLTALMLAGAVWRHDGLLVLGSGRVTLLAGVAGAAMGLQNAAVRGTTTTPVTTTFLTGALVGLGEDLAAWWRDRSDLAARARLGRHGTAWLAFLAGGIAGAAAATGWHLWAFAIPVVALLMVAAVPQPASGPSGP